MIRLRCIRVAGIILVVAAFISVSAYGQPPELAEVPAHLPTVARDLLIKWREALLKERSDLTTRMEIQNKQTAPKNSPEESKLRREAAKIRDDMKAHLSECRKFNQKIKLFVHHTAHLTSKNLLEDPELRKRARLRVDEIERRISGVNKAISLLDDQANPKLQEAMGRLTEDMRENLDELLWVSLDMITLDLIEALKFAKGGMLSKAEKLKSPVWQELYKGKDRLVAIQKRVTGIEADVVEGALKTIAEIDDAKELAYVIKGMEKARDLVARSKEIRDQTKKATQGSTYDTLFNVSVIAGQVGLSLLEGTCKPVAVAGHWVTRAIEGALLVKLLEEGEQQLIEMDLQAATRQQKKAELVHKVNKLQEEKEILETALGEGRQN